jgi:hypothetical protein
MAYNAAYDFYYAVEEIKMAELKTKKNNASVTDFLNSVADEQRRNDAFTVLAFMRKAAQAEPSMWGDSIVGFGSYHYKYASGQEGDWFPIGFSPRKQNLTLYIMGGFEQHVDLLSKLGKHKLGKGCLYVNKLADVDLKVLNELITRNMETLSQNKS